MLLELVDDEDFALEIDIIKITAKEIFCMAAKMWLKSRRIMGTLFSR